MTKTETIQLAQERQKKVQYSTITVEGKTYYLFVDPAGNESRVEVKRT